MIISRSAPDFVARIAAAAGPIWHQLGRWITAAAANVTRETLEGWAQRLVTYEREWSTLRSEATIGGGLPSVVVAKIREITADLSLNVAAAAAAHTAAIATVRNELLALLNTPAKRPAYAADGTVTGVVYTSAELTTLVGHMTVLRTTFLTYG